MADQRKIEDYDRILVVEGYSDLLFYAEVLEELGTNEKVFIKELGGKAGTRAKLETLLSPGLLNSKSAIAFIFDADTAAETTRQSLQELSFANHSVSRLLTANGPAESPRSDYLLFPVEIKKGKSKRWFGIPGPATQRTQRRNDASRVTFPV